MVPAFREVQLGLNLYPIRKLHTSSPALDPKGFRGLGLGYGASGLGFRVFEWWIMG